MAKFRGYVEINSEGCKGCQLCIVSCPTNTLGLSKNINKFGYHYSSMIKDECIGCQNCAVICPDAVITVYREKI